MARHDLERLGATYAAAERFVASALRRDDSLFTPGVPIWSLLNLEELDRLYVQAFDPGPGNFEEKLRIQIGGGSSGAIELMAEIHYVYFLPASGGIAGDTKRQRIREILSWASPPTLLPDDLAGVLDHGIGGGGIGFGTYKWASISYFVRFGLAWKRLTPHERERGLADPWEFKSVLDGVPTTGGGTYAKEALLHLVHPDTFERIFSRGEKGMLVQRFADLVTDQTVDVDRQIAQIRQRLSDRFGDGFDFYWAIPVVAMWKPTENRWSSFIYWAGRFRASAEFDANERDYKLALAEMLAPARRAVLAGEDDWQDPLATALRSKHNNLIGWRETDRFVKWAASNPDAAHEGLAAIWQTEAEPATAMAAFLERLPKDIVTTPGQRVSIGSVLLMAGDPYRCPPYRPSPVQLALKLTDFGAPATDEVARYTQALDFFDAVLDRAAGQGVDLRDRLDAQSVTWAVTTEGPSNDWLPEDRSALDRFRLSGGTVPDEIEVEPPREPGKPEPTGRPSLMVLADELLIDVEQLNEIADLLDVKRQLVFYGPPGTGKTFVAHRLALALAGDSTRVRVIQFHPSYAYEDFVEGYRPRLFGTTPGFELVPGPLKRMAELAAANPGHKHFLVIDEMNRGNVAKVLGELYFLLEYRDQAVDLQYSATPFTLPGNLFFIGTMNTADRSIALLDAALRRRFAFVPFFPDREPIAGLLGRWLTRHRPEMAWVAEMVEIANAKLADRNGAIGPSFFLHADLDDARLGVIWRYEILPYLEDHFFDDPGRLAEFEIERLRPTVSSVSSPAGPDIEAS